MKTAVAASALIAAALTLAACGKKNEAANAPAAEAPTETAAPAAAPAATESAAAPAVTDEQAKKLLAELPAPYNAGDPAHGKAVFARCRSCHTTNEGGADMTGPNLYGVFGRKAGTKAGYNYSDALKAAGWTWDAQHIDKWIENPRADVPGTKMSFVGLKDPKDRTDVIAYLKTATGK
jgi:cytochrome c